MIAGLRPGRRHRLLRRLRLALACVCAAGALLLLAGQARPQTEDPPPQPPPPSTDVAAGRRLFQAGCGSCHGLDGRGVRGQGPSLAGAGEAAADFYLRTGRMPLDEPSDQPTRSRPAYSKEEIRSIVSYVGSLGPGPEIPRVDPARGRINEGFRLFTESCAGCHQVAAQGGTITGARVPGLQDSSALDIAEAVRMGPYLMPRFSEKQIDQRELDSIARFVLSTRDPDDRGGWGIGHIGPIPEGMVAWLLAGAALLLVIGIIGERTER